MMTTRGRGLSTVNIISRIIIYGYFIEGQQHHWVCCSVHVTVCCGMRLFVCGGFNLKLVPPFSLSAHAVYAEQRYTDSKWRLEQRCVP